jgi:hypothetical protein
MGWPSEPEPGPVLGHRVIQPWERPEAEYPALVPVGTLRFDRTEPSAIAVSTVLAYHSGFEFFVTRLLRPDGPGFDRGRGPGPRRARRDGPRVHQLMEVGVEFADGRRAFATDVPPSAGDDPAGPVLHGGGGVSSTHRGDSRWWTWPLPPAGPLVFICRLGAAELRVSLDAQLILDASQRSVRAWPGDLIP